jgi:hypothetical protein
MNDSVIRMSHREFLGVYGRCLRGGSRFIWNEETLGIIIHGFFQFHRSGQRLPLHLIAPHLRSLIREYVKNLVCVWNNTYHHWADAHFDLICARWVRLPSIRAILLKLRECSVFTHLVSTTAASYRSLRDDGVMSMMFYNAMTCELSRMGSSHPGCSSYRLAAVPRISTEPVFGYCFTCGDGLSDKIDLNFIPRCLCLDPAGGGSVCVCSGCFEGVME